MLRRYSDSYGVASSADILHLGELAVDTATGLIYIGDDVTELSGLTAVNGPPAAGSVTTSTIADGAVTDVKRGPRTQTTQTTDYTLVLADANTQVIMNVAGVNTVTVPTNASAAFPIGTEIEVMQYGAGATSIAGAGGVTVRVPGGVAPTFTQYRFQYLVKIGTNEWAFAWR